MKEGRTKKKIATIVALVFLLSILAGCASDPSRYNTQRGAGLDVEVLLQL